MEMTARSLTFGNTPVPYTVSWTEEEQFFLDRCRYFGRLAICQKVAPGEGQPRFGKPHSQRQRETIARGLCDLCGRPLSHRTRVSLSHARPIVHGAEGMAILQVEPLLHRECAAQSMQFCPSLRRDIRAATLMVRQVTRWRAQCAVMSPEYIGSIISDYEPKPEDRILGHAKVELLAWIDRNEAWLGTAEPIA
jgi:hypothetical protein